MSHKFSFLQAFVGYDSARSILLAAFRRNVMLKNLQVAWQVRRCQLTEIILLADMGKFQTQICQRLKLFQQMSLYWSALARATLVHKCYRSLITRPKILNSHCIQRLKEVAALSARDCEYGHIYYKHIVIWRCKNLLQKIGLLKKQRASIGKCCLICNLQPNLDPSIYWSFKYHLQTSN